MVPLSLSRLFRNNRQGAIQWHAERCRDQWVVRDPRVELSVRYDNIRFISAAAWLTLDTCIGSFTLSFDYIGDALNGQLAMQPTGGASEEGLLQGIVYKKLLTHFGRRGGSAELPSSSAADERFASAVDRGGVRRQLFAESRWHHCRCREGCICSRSSFGHSRTTLIATWQSFGSRYRCN